MLSNRTKRIRTRSTTTALVASAVLLGAAAPVQAQEEPPIIPPSNVGTGVLNGTVEFTSPSEGIPGALETCVEGATARVEATAPVVVLNTVLTGFVGPVQITADSVATCEKAEQGAGSIAVEAHGVGPTGSQLDCGPFADDPLQPKLTGEYVRVGNAVTVQASGSCTVNKFAISNVTFISVVSAVATRDDPSTPEVDNWETLDLQAGAPDDPTTPEDDPTPIKYARLDGTFAVTP